MRGIPKVEWWEISVLYLNWIYGLYSSRTLGITKQGKKMNKKKTHTPFTQGVAKVDSVVRINM